MSVILRCPACGTTQAHPGECDTCSDGEVRYFCTNHEDGIWLEAPSCSRCGATFGDPPIRRPIPVRPSGAARPADPPEFRPPAGRAVPEPHRRPASPPPPIDDRELDEPDEPEVLPRTPLEELLAEITEGRARSRRPYEAEEVEWAEPRARRTGIPVAGCLFRMVSLVFLLIAALILFMFLLFGGFIVG